ncbi:unnamed protein product [Paramecium primaurelia]|uniref:T4 RNA ligase 1-like N-terminal domain-containing protein n=1 Tax=Paramecium primaurelia TaxID=5886 RepID=A0A8S1PZR5_PARPR|nr:unnamed protein product [Paramecium primaurelia]
MQQQGNYISDPAEYLQKMKEHKKILLVKQDIFDFQLYDISLHKKGPMEDKLYLKNPFFLMNVRRGNSILVHNDSINICRRGMRKFYDLERKYIDYEMEQQNIKLSSYHQKACQNILDPIKQAIQEGKKIHLYKLVKENGEHCQISFTNNYWLVASKNCTILFQTENDLNQYNHLRHTWAKLIAKQWLEIIKQQNYDDLKSFLNQHTLIGEYCGNPNYQHITKYSHIQLIFYAIVNNNSPDICLPVEHTKNICKKFKLQFVKNSQIKNFNNYKAVLSQLSIWSQLIGQGPMELVGEGSVIYFIAEDQIGNQQTISICKLKSMEYLIYRKLRELLKILIQKINLNENYQLSVQLGKFLNELQIIIKQYFPPQPIRYYLHISKLAFEEVYNDKIPFERIRYNFVDFLEHIQNMQEDKMSEIDELGEVKQKNYQRHVRIILLTLPMFLEDKTLQSLKDNLNLQCIECQYMWRNQKVFAQRALSILHMIPKLPYNVNNEEQLNDYLKNSPLQNQDPTNIIFVFLGMNQEAFNQSLKNLQCKDFQFSNPIASSFSVQFTIMKPKVQQLSLERWLEKGQVYLKDCQKNFPNRTFVLDELDINKLDSIIKQFEFAEQPSIEEQNDLDLEESDEDVQAQNKIVIIYPLMIPGSGKSTLVEYLKQNYKDYPLYDICADEITLQLIKNKLGDSTDSLAIKFEKVFIYIKETFQQEFNKKINEIINSNHQKAVLFIDRNCVPHTLSYMIEHVLSIQNDITLKKGVSIKIYNIGLTFPNQESNILNTPFCFDYALTILNRLLVRNDHILLGNDVLYKTQVCMKNLALYTGFKAKDSYFHKFHLQKIIPMNYPQDRFNLEKNDLHVAQELITQCVLTSQLTRDLGQGEEFNKLIEFMYLIKEKYKISECNLEEECRQNCQRLSVAIKKLLLP